MRSKSRLYPENAGVGLDHMSAADKLALAMKGVQADAATFARKR
jgi:hypothetical protein